MNLHNTNILSHILKVYTVYACKCQYVLPVVIRERAFIVEECEPVERVSEDAFAVYFTRSETNKTSMTQRKPSVNYLPPRGNYRHDVHSPITLTVHCSRQKLSAQRALKRLREAKRGDLALATLAGCLFDTVRQFWPNLLQIKLPEMTNYQGRISHIGKLGTCLGRQLYGGGTPH